jgi:competence protein ComEA
MMHSRKPRSTLRARLGAATACLAVLAVSALPARAQAGKPAAPPQRIQVDVNSADAKTLEALPGIGPALAQRIIQGRPYRNLADLDKVKGLGKSKIGDLKGQITFGPAIPQPGGSKRQPADTSPAKLAPGEKININTAAVKDLDRLPGIGPVRAQAIVDYRAQYGNFKTIEDIQKVKGIKQGAFSKIKDNLKVSD